MVAGGSGGRQAGRQVECRGQEDKDGKLK